MFDKKIKVNEIIKDIAENHHGYLKQEMSIIKGLAYKILKVHFDDCKDELINVHRAYGKVENEIELSLVKKQMVVLPLIWDYEKKPSDELKEEIIQAIDDVENDNELLLASLEDLRKATNNYTMPPSGCPTYDTTYRKMETLHNEILKYMEKERELYKLFK